MNNNVDLDNHSTEKQELKTRDTEPETLKSELACRTTRLKDPESATEQAKSFLQRELRKKTEAARAKDFAIKEPKQKPSRKVPLESHLTEKQELLKGRNTELKTLRSEVTSLKTQLSELASAKEQTESFLQQELRKKTEALRANHRPSKEFDELSSPSSEDDLEKKLRQSEELLKARDTELDRLRLEVTALSGRLTEKELDERRRESLLQEELRRIEDELRAKSSTIEALEKKLAHNTELESQVQEQRQLLKARDADLEALRSEAIALTGRLAELGSAEAQKESFLYEELRITKETLRAKESASEELVRQINGLQSQLREKEKFLATRNKEVEKLGADLKEKTLALAKRDIADFQSIKRRNIWKRRFARLGLPGKPN